MTPAPTQTVGMWSTAGPMSEWSDWYRREDPTGWVLPRILRTRAERHPDRDYLRFADGPWRSYGEVNATANRVANALIARGLRPGEAVSTLLPNCEENLAVWFGMSVETASPGRSPRATSALATRFASALTSP